MAASKSVPVVFHHFEVPENVDGNFKAKYVSIAILEKKAFVIVIEIHIQYLYLYLLFCTVFVFVIKYFCVVLDLSLHTCTISSY